MSRSSPSAKSHVILARDAPTAVILRRGPSKVVGTFGWNRKDDTFSSGQWLSGRIYEEYCDLSPDGKHFLYFAVNGKWDSETKGAWTGLSFAPYLKTIGLWAKGDTVGGGGRFLDNRRYWIRGWAYHSPIRMSTYTSKLQLVGDDHAPPQEPATADKPLPHRWQLRKLPQEYALITPDGGVLRHPDWSWADWDTVQTRLVWTAGGRLSAAPLEPNGPGGATELHDFNQYEFQRLRAPY